MDPTLSSGSEFYQWVKENIRWLKDLIVSVGLLSTVQPPVTTYRWWYSWWNMEPVFLRQQSVTTRQQLRNVKRMRRALMAAPIISTVSPAEFVSLTWFSTWYDESLIKLIFSVMVNKMVREVTNRKKLDAICLTIGYLW